MKILQKYIDEFNNIDLELTKFKLKKGKRGFYGADAPRVYYKNKDFSLFISKSGDGVHFSFSKSKRFIFTLAPYIYQKTSSLENRIVIKQSLNLKDPELGGTLKGYKTINF